MATLANLRDLVKQVIHDSSYSDEMIGDYLNAGVNEVAGLVTLPELAASDSVLTNSVSISGITLPSGSPVSVESTAHGYSSGDRIYISDVNGTTELNGSSYTVTRVDADNFTLDGTDGDDFTAYDDDGSGTCRSAYVSMPADYHKSLQAVVSRTQDDKITLMTSWIRFIERFPTLDNVGTLDTCVVRGDRLYYQYLPSTQDLLTLYYYRKPTDMSDDDDTPDGIPSHLQRSLLVNYSVKEIFSQGGGKTARINRQEAELKFGKAVKELMMFVGPPDGKPRYVTDEGDYYS